jgi:DNA-binding SARP family transcriptional activator
VWRVRFGVLGPVAVWTETGTTVDIPGRKVRALLAGLLVHAGRLIPAERLIDDIWEGRPPPPSAHATLKAKVSQLRRALEDAEPGGRDLVASGPAGYSLRVSPDALDARRFAVLTAQARAADPGTAAALFGEALELWRGPALADFADASFATGYIAQLSDQRVAVHEDAAELRLALGQHAGELAALVAEHPLRERLRGCAMRALYRAGRQAEALASYQDLRTRLADELGLDPSPELAALHQAILTRDPALDPSPCPSPPPSVAGGGRGNLPAARTELLGRDSAVIEVRKLLAAERLVTCATR